MFKKKKRLLGVIAGFVFLVLGVVLFSPLDEIARYKYFPDIPKDTHDEIEIDGVSKPVSVYFDHMGVPHIEAQNTKDLVFAVGFVQARYRLFQMDLLRHLAQGRLAELLGDRPIMNSSTVKFDLAMRGWDFEGKAFENLESTTPFNKQLLESFANGVNQAMQKYRSVEHRILGVKPEPWQITDSIIIGLLQAWTISHNWEQEAVRAALAMDFGTDIAAQIYPHHSFSDYSTIDDLIDQKTKKELPEAVSKDLKEMFPIQRKEIENPNFVLGDLAELRPSASNAWVVGPQKSKSHMPILANDMHMTHAVPSVVFLQHIKTPDLNVMGVTLPGVPFIVGGHNEKVAWGATSAVADAMDLVVEKIDPEHSDRVLSGKETCFLHNEVAEIKVKKKLRTKKLSFPLRRTCRGTVFNDMYPGFFPENAPLVSLVWKTPNLSQSFENLYYANQAKNVYELRERMMKLPAPVQNITAADTEGNFAFFTTGSVPLRLHHRGTFPTPGWIEKYRWQDRVRLNQMPHDFNSQRGYYINTNNLSQSPYHHEPMIQVDSAPSYRYERAKDLIESQVLHDQDSIEKIQRDHKLVRGKILTKFFLEDLESESHWNEREKHAIELLKNWDFGSDTDSVASTLFHMIYRESVIKALKPKLSQGAFHVFAKQRYSTNAMDEWFKKSDHIVWDNFSTKDKKEDRKKTIVSALRISMAKLEKRFGKNMSEWTWGRLHMHKPKHAFGSKKILSFFNLEETPLAGSLDSVWKAHYDFINEKEPFKVIAGPTLRFSIDLANIDQARFAIDTGESGWPKSENYGDFYEYWKKGELAQLPYQWEEIKKIEPMKLLPKS